MSKVAVIGSLATDFIVTTKQKPNQGETVFGERFTTAFGGKGANQALAACRLGVQTQMIGMVGDDIFGDEIKRNLLNNGLDTSHIKTTSGVSSGSAHITLFDGDNSIVVVPAANNELTIEDIKRVGDIIVQADFVILQNEIPQVVNEMIINLCHKENTKLVYNPAPARHFSLDILDKIDYLTPNEHEFEVIFPNETLSAVLKRYPNRLIVTLGKQGAIYFDGKKEVLVPSYQVDVVDTTGAGDTFNGALVAGLLYQLNLHEAIEFANLASSISIQKFGAQGGMPTLSTLKKSKYFKSEWKLNEH